VIGIPLQQYHRPEILLISDDYQDAKKTTTLQLRSKAAIDLFKDLVATIPIGVRNNSDLSRMRIMDAMHVIDKASLMAIIYSSYNAAHYPASSMKCIFDAASFAQPSSSIATQRTRSLHPPSSLCLTHRTAYLAIAQVHSY
jgi:hypothetical protein